MSDVPSEVVARGRAIFERLRGGTADEDGTPAEPDPDDPATEALAPDQVDEEPVAENPLDDAVAEIDDVVDELDGSPETEDESPEQAGEPPEAEDEPVGAEVDEEAELAPSAPLDLRDPIAVVPDAPSDSVADETADDQQVPTIEAQIEDLVALDPPAEEQIDAPDGHVGDARRTVPEETSSFTRPLPRVIAVANQKGGVGKTTTTVNLAACLADLGYRVLILDLDPQGNASTGVGINIRDLAGSMYDVLLHDASLEDTIEATSVRNLYVAPANLELAGAEIELVPAFSRELKLRAAIDTVRDDYDFVFIDCPPSLGLLTVNSMAAASEVLVPIQCEYYALEGLGQLLRNVGLVQKNLNPALEVSVIVCVMYDARTKLADQVVAEVRSHFGEKVCRTVVPRTVRLSEAPSYGQPISAFDPSSRGAIAYRELAKEVSGGTPIRAG